MTTIQLRTLRHRKPDQGPLHGHTEKMCGTIKSIKYLHCTKSGNTYTTYIRAEPEVACTRKRGHRGLHRINARTEWK